MTRETINELARRMAEPDAESFFLQQFLDEQQRRVRAIRAAEQHETEIRRLADQLCCWAPGKVPPIRVGLFKKGWLLATRSFKMRPTLLNGDHNACSLYVDRSGELISEWLYGPRITRPRDVSFFSIDSVRRQIAAYVFASGHPWPHPD